MHQLFVWLSLLFVVSSPGAPDPEAHQLLDQVRMALAGGRDVMPERIEIDAVYHYADDDRSIIDHTVIEPGHRLYQERQIDGRTIRRGWQADAAFLEGPDGRIDLEAPMSDDLEAYLCLRQLDFAILCPGAEASLVGEADGEHQVVAVHRHGKKLAELEVDVVAHRLHAVRYPDIDEMADDSDLMLEVHFSEYRAVGGGWTLPHRVETRAGGEPRSTYSVERWTLAGD